MNDAEIPEFPSGAPDDLFQVEQDIGSSAADRPELKPRARPAGSPEEARMGREVLHAFQAAHAPATALPMRVPAIANYIELCCIPLMLAGILAALVQPVLGVLILGGALGLYASEIAGVGLLARVFVRRESASILAAIPAQGRELRTMIVTTPLDAPPFGLMDRSRLNWLNRNLPRVIAIVGLAALLNAGWLSFSSDQRVERLLTLPALLLITILALIGERAWSATTRTRTSVYALNALVKFAATVRTQPARWVDVWSFAAGGGSISGEALRAFITENNLKPETTYIVNVQPEAEEPRMFALAEGPLVALKSAPALVRVLTTSTEARPGRRIPRASQAAVSFRHGFQTVSIFPANNADGSDGESDIVRVLTDALDLINREMIERNRLATLARATDRRQNRAVRPPQV